MHATQNKTTGSPDATTKNASGKLPFFQPKLTINQPGDQYEQEADRMADHVMRMPMNPNSFGEGRGAAFFKPSPLSISRLQRKCKSCEDDEKIHRKENSSQPAEAGSETASYINSLSSKGSPLSDSAKSFFEPRFGQDFSSVKIHNDSEAAKSSQAVNALAYTVGNNIVFNQNQFSPESDGGKKLLAHELTHVVQQKSIENSSIMRTPLSLTQQLDIRNLTITEIEDEDYELKKYLANQTEGSPENYHLYEEEIRFSKEIAKRKRNERGIHKSRKYTKPRSLSECIDINIIDDFELDTELDLIHEALISNLSKADRRKLIISRAILETERNKRRGLKSSADKAEAIRNSFIPSIDKSPVDGFIEVMKTIENIKQAETPGMYAIFHEGKVLYITTDQYVQLMAQVKKSFAGDLEKIKSRGLTAESSYTRQKAIDEECYITSFWVETLGRIDDPGNKIEADIDNMNDSIIRAKTLLGKNKLEAAAKAFAQAEIRSVDANLLYQDFQNQIQRSGENIITGLEITIALYGLAAGWIIVAGVAAAAPSVVLSAALTFGTPVAADLAAPVATNALIDVAAPAAIDAVAPAAIDIAAPAASTLPTVASQAPTALAAVNTTTAAEAASSISTVAKATAAATLTTLAGDGKQEEDNNNNNQFYPIIWPLLLHYPTTMFFLRVPSPDRDYTEENQLVLKAKRQREKDDPNFYSRYYHIHHINPLFLGGADLLQSPSKGGNGIILPAIQHIEGHRRLANQPQMLNPPSPLTPLPANIYDHPLGTKYILSGFK